MLPERTFFNKFLGESIYEGEIIIDYRRNYSVSGEAVFSFYVKPGFNYSMQVREYVAAVSIWTNILHICICVSQTLNKTREGC